MPHPAMTEQTFYGHCLGLCQPSVSSQMHDCCKSGDTKLPRSAPLYQRQGSISGPYLLFRLSYPFEAVEQIANDPEVREP